MNLNWSLKELYDTFEGEAFQLDLKTLDEKISYKINWIKKSIEDNQQEKEKLETYIQLSQELYALKDKLNAFISLTLSVDSKNQTAVRYDAILTKKIGTLAEAETLMSKWISQVEGLEKVIETSEILKAHRFYLQEIVEANKYMLSEKEEVLLTRMRSTGSTAWVNYKNKLISMHKVDIDVKGEQKTLPLTEVLNMAYDADKEVRKRAYYAEIASYSKIEEGVAAALNAIKGEVLTTCDVKGYSSPLEMTLNNSRMDKDILEAMLQAMKESLPHFRTYLKRKAELLGYKKGLPFYELYAPVVSKEMTFSYEQGKAFVEKNFRSFSEPLGEFAKQALKNCWLDVLPKEGKRSGAFCRNIRSIKESRILLNYGGAFGDVITMAHELGHGFHGACLNDESYLNTSYPMPLAETASTFCETIVKKVAIKEADKEEAFAILETEISDATQVIVDIYSRFLFESALFEQREESPLSVTEIKELMLKAQKEAYGDGLDAELLHPYMWTWKSHYYSAGTNFYNFPYAFGLLFAKGLYAEYMKDIEAFPTKYEKLLSVTGKMRIKEVASTANIDVSDIAFWRSSLKTIEEDIEAFIKLSYEI